MTKITILMVALAVSGLAGYSLMDEGASQPIEASLPGDYPGGATGSGGEATGRTGGAPGELIGQSTGTVCETASGQCRVPEGPINSFCSCSGTPGRIVR